MEENVNVAAVNETAETTDNFVDNSQDNGIQIEDASNEIKNTDNVSDKNKPNVKRSVSERISKIKNDAQSRFDKMNSDWQAKYTKLEDELLKYRAEEQGVTVEELRLQKQKDEQDLKNAIRNDPYVRDLEIKEFERQKQDLLSLLQDSFPDDGIEDVEHFEPEFYKMLQVGVDPIKAYNAAVVLNRKSTPKSSGSIKSYGTEKSGVYTKEMVKEMSTKDVMKNYNNIIKSMKTW